MRIILILKQETRKYGKFCFSLFLSVIHLDIADIIINTMPFPVKIYDVHQSLSRIAVELREIRNYARIPFPPRPCNLSIIKVV